MQKERREVTVRTVTRRLDGTEDVHETKRTQLVYTRATGKQFTSVGGSLRELDDDGVVTFVISEIRPTTIDGLISKLKRQAEEFDKLSPEEKQTELDRQHRALSEFSSAQGPNDSFSAFVIRPRHDES